MNVIRKLWQAVENLAAGLNALAATCHEMNEGVRQRVGLDPASLEAPALSNGGPTSPLPGPAANGGGGSRRRQRG